MDKWERAFRDLVKQGFYRSDLYVPGGLHWSWVEHVALQDPDIGLAPETVAMVAEVLTFTEASTGPRSPNE